MTICLTAPCPSVLQSHLSLSVRAVGGAGESNGAVGVAWEGIGSVGGAAELSVAV